MAPRKKAKKKVAKKKIAKKKGIKDVYLGSQKHAIPFYQKLGYKTVGDYYFEAGIEHKKMVKKKAGLSIRLFFIFKKNIKLDYRYENKLDIITLIVKY